MSLRITRRIAVMGGLTTPFLAPRIAAATTLDQLRAAGTVRIGLVNQPPYSTLNPDGTIGGLYPTLAHQIMASLGVPNVEPYVATYGELIPGLQAGRWQMIAAALRLTKARCQQVLFADPITFDGGAIAYVPSHTPSPPADLKAVAALGLTVGVLQGSYLEQTVTGAGVAARKVLEFPSNPALLDGLAEGRIGVAVSTDASLKLLQRQRGGFKIVYPLPEDPPVGSSFAFALGDTALLNAFQGKLRAMRASGALAKLSASYGFDPPPANLVNVTSEEACSRL